MFIQNCLTPKEEIVTVTPQTPIPDLFRTLEQHGLESIPVIDDKGLFLGITGYGHVMKTLAESGEWDRSLREGTVADHFYVIDPLSINNDFEETLPIMVRYPFVPVVDEDGFTFLGIVKISDIEAALASTYGYELPGVRFLLALVLDAPHELEHILESVKPYDVNIISVVTFDAGDAAARRILLKTGPTEHVEEICKNLEERGFRIMSVKVTEPVS
ncbi:CBS domain-containing protein [Desmospora profundinema]|uniref:CBS domain-containing protein n=1 Tax=Desmospora profundinema TaxID=1571184 RepID=A0ABU1IJN8_9BACL|nr:CBS domain-containing protein [Desmospora profundinema]MDR6224985.1 CBS domain-containing protein [Desmospora profundinema]